MFGFGGLERWNEMVGMDWTGMVEWNGMQRGKQRSIKAHAHLVPSFIIQRSFWFVVLYH